MKKDLWAENQNIYTCTINKNDIKKSSFEDFVKDLGLTIKQKELTKRSKIFSSLTPKEIKNYVQKNIIYQFLCLQDSSLLIL